jgi:hypothetical protein
VAKSKRGTVVVSSTPSTTMAQGFTEAEKRGVGITPTERTGNPSTSPMDALLSGATRVGNAMLKVLTPKPPKPIGNNQKDAHNRRAYEFQMSEDERQRTLKRLDAMSAADKAAGKR